MYRTCRFGGLGFYVLVLFVICCIAIYFVCTPQYNEVRTSVYSVSCLDALNKVSGAVEDYESNNSEKITKPGKKVDLDFLKEHGYLDEIRLCPETGIFVFNNEGEVVCTLHGKRKGNTK